jgi:predicted O-linked N-acetylglucosamine transferase (SPINDLY family)
MTAAELRDAVSTVRAERLDVLYFTEVGLTVPTRWLASHRLAKSQVTGYGHPVTTGSPFMDYYIGGMDIEDNEEIYRERLIVIPGLGVDTAAPPMPSDGLERPTDGVLRITSLASFDKLNSKMLGAWGEILRSVPGRVEFHLFPSAPVNLRSKIGLILEQTLPADVLRIHYDADRQTCIDTLAQSDLYLDSYPFGGYNTVIEALSVGCPIVTYKGRWAYQRIAASMVEKLGLANALVVSSWEDYVTTAKRLCSDPGERRAYHQALTYERIVQSFCNTDASSHFAAAFEWISKNGPTHGPPIAIAAGEIPKVLG